VNDVRSTFPGWAGIWETVHKFAICRRSSSNEGDQIRLRIEALIMRGCHDQLGKLVPGYRRRTRGPWTAIRGLVWSLKVDEIVRGVEIGGCRGLRGLGLFELPVGRLTGSHLDHLRDEGTKDSCLRMG